MTLASSVRRLIQACPGAFALFRPDAGFTIVAASAEYFSIAHADESILGRPLFDAFPDNPDLEGVQGSLELRQSLARVVATGQPDRVAPVRYDVRRPAEAGGGFEERYWSLLNLPVLGDDGRIEFIMHRVEETTTKANQKAIEILESITEGFFTLDRKWRFGYVNAEAHRILGVEPGSLAGRVIWDTYPGLDETPFWQTYHHTMELRIKSSATAYYPKQERWYEITVFPAPEGISVYFRNVTEHKRLEAQREALADLSQRLSNAPTSTEAAYEGAVVIGTQMNVSRVGYGTVDHESGNLFVDRDWVKAGVESLAGVTPLRDYGTFIDSLRRGEFTILRDVRKDPRTGDAAGALEAKHARSFVNVPVMERGRLVAVLYVNDDKVRDWTSEELEFIQEAASRIRTAVERATAEKVLRDSEGLYRALNERLVDAGRLKDEFLATLAHELRNPLAPIRNALTIQRLAADDPAAIAQTRDLMERQVDHLVRLVDDLLDLSRFSRGLVELKIERVSLTGAIRSALDASHPVIAARSHELTTELPEQELVVDADPVRLTQILTNLLNNAAKFTPARGKLWLSLQREGEHAVIRVRDNGIGLAADMVERVFSVFEQVDRSYSQVNGGLGIGLTLVRRLVEDQGGSVWATSAGLGTGSEFVVTLPLASAVADPAAPPSPGTSDETATRPQRILIADDNEDAAISMATILEMCGHELRVAANGAQAVALAREFRPHVAVLDIAMPELDGLAAARAIRALPGGQRILLVALSGFGQQADIQRSLDAGFDEHLVKPIDLARISAVIDANPNDLA